LNSSSLPTNKLRSGFVAADAAHTEHLIFLLFHNDNSNTPDHSAVLVDGAETLGHHSP
jgi:hypothetical protein